MDNYLIAQLSDCTNHLFLLLNKGMGDQIKLYSRTIAFLGEADEGNPTQRGCTSNAALYVGVDVLM